MLKLIKDLLNIINIISFIDLDLDILQINNYSINLFFIKNFIYIALKRY